MRVNFSHQWRKNPQNLFGHQWRIWNHRHRIFLNDSVINNKWWVIRLLLFLIDIFCDKWKHCYKPKKTFDLDQNFLPKLSRSLWKHRKKSSFPNFLKWKCINQKNHTVVTDAGNYSCDQNFLVLWFSNIGGNNYGFGLIYWSIPKKAKKRTIF